VNRLAEGRAVRFRPTVAEIDLGAVRHNVRTLRPPDAALMAVVKANGYGHGAIAVARVALEAGATWLGVALVEEGLRLREAGIEAPVLVLTEVPPGAERAALGAGLTPTAYTDAGLDRLADAAEGRVGVHVKVDTGMHRVGLRPEHAVPFVSRLLTMDLAFDGLWTHLATSEDLSDPFMAVQIASFRRVLADIHEAGIGRPPYLHVANTGGLLADPSVSFDMVRVGIGLYGIAAGPDVAGRADLRPVMTWRSAVSLVKRVDAGERLSYGLRYRLERPSTIATVPVGYADGYSRLLAGRAQVLIRGRRYPVAGSVTMDQLMVDCGDDVVEAGDDVVLIGSQGDDRITAEEVAAWMGTTGYEVVCGVSERVARLHVDEGVPRT